MLWLFFQGLAPADTDTTEVVSQQECYFDVCVCDDSNTGILKKQGVNDYLCSRTHVASFQTVQWLSSFFFLVGKQNF